MPFNAWTSALRRGRGDIVLVAAAAALTLAVSAPARAHPHIIADVTVEMIYDEHGGVAAIRESWAYDAFYSSLVRRMADTDRDGKMSDSERAAFGEQQIKALAEFGYYTKLTSAGAQVPLTAAADHEFVEDAKGLLVLRFTLPLKSPIQSRSYRVEIFDPAFFAYFTTKNGEGVRLVGAGPGCSSDVTTPQPIDLRNTASVPAALWKALDGSADDGRKFINAVDVSCR